MINEENLRLSQFGKPDYRMPDLNETIEKTLWEVLSDRTDKVVEIALAARKSVLKAATGCSEFVGETSANIRISYHEQSHHDRH